MPKYDRNVIISLVPNNLIEEKCLQTEIPTYVININFDETGKMVELSDSDKFHLFQLTNNSRLYVVAHGVKDNPYMMGNGNTAFLSVSDVATLISNNVIIENINGLRISLKICEAAKQIDVTTLDPTDETQSKTIVAQTSLAGLFQMALYNAGIFNVDIVAHKELVSTFRNCYTNRVYSFGTDKVIDNAMNLMFDNFKKIFEMSKDFNHLDVSSHIIAGNAFLVEQIMLMVKLRNNSRNEKVLLTWFANEPVRISVFKANLWNERTQQAFTDAELPEEANKFNQSRSFIGKIQFLQMLSSTDTTGSQIANQLLQQTNDLKI